MSMHNNINILKSATIVQMKTKSNISQQPIWYIVHPIYKAAKLLN